MSWMVAALLAALVSTLNESRMVSAQSQPATPAASADEPPPEGATDAPAAATDATDESQVELPPDYTPPREIPEGASSDEQWIVHLGDDSKPAVTAARRDYYRVFSNGSFQDDADRENFENYIRWQLSQFTLRENLVVNKNQVAIADAKKKILGDLDRAKKAGGQVFDVYAQTLVREAPKLFEYHFIARLNGAEILGVLSDPDGKPYMPAAAPLLDFLKQQQQLEGVRVPAVRGLARIMRDGQPSSDLRDEILKTFVNELQTGNPENDVLPARIAQELGMFEITSDKSNTPVVVNALMETLADKRRPFRVRAEAAAALGRLPLDNSINIDLIVHEIVRLADEMALAADKEFQKAAENGQNPNYIKWRKPFAKLYVAFQGDTTANIRRGHGLLNKNALSGAAKKVVADGYNLVLPPFLSLMVNQPFEAAHMQKIQEWLKNNAPRNRRVHDSFKEILSGDDKKPAPVSVSGTGPGETASE